MRGKVQYIAVLASLALLVLGGPAQAAAGPQAFLHQVAQGLDVVGVFDSGIRTSHFVAEGTATFPSPFCSQALADRLAMLAAQGGVPLPSGTPRSCTVTVDGHDTICVDTTMFVCAIGPSQVAFLTGGLEADIAIVVAFDNVVEAPDAVVMTGHVTVPLGHLQGVPFGPTGITPELKGTMATMGPAVPLFVMDGSFTDQKMIALDPEAGFMLQSTGVGPQPFTATFRSPFRITLVGKPDKPLRGNAAFYLADDGELITIQSDEYSLGVPTLRGEVTFGP